jgi:hypothetical protein
MQRAAYQDKLKAAAEIAEQAPGAPQGDMIGDASKAIAAA